MMITSIKKRLWFYIIPWVLPLILVLPYALFVENFRLLQWVWQTFYAPFWLLLLFTLISVFVCAICLVRSWKLGRNIFNLVACTVLVHVGYLAMTERRHGILLLLFFLSALALFLSEKLRQLLELPYFDSRRGWWESYPSGIPFVRAFLLSKNANEEQEVIVSNLGESGCFIFSSKGEISKGPMYIKLKTNNKIIMESPVELVFLTKDKMGAGLAYKEAEVALGDWGKDYSDFLNYLRRAGYAQT